jgi:DNA-binding IclR family transcriptional regulator
MMEIAKNHERYMVPGLERGLKLLSVFSRATPELSLADLARRLDLSRSSVFRLAYTLEQLGFLRRTKTGYVLGPRVLTLGFDYLSSQELVELARPELERLRDLTGASAHLGVLDGTEVIYVAQAQGRGGLVSRVSVGTRLPAHATSMGRLLLGALSDAELAERYPGPLQRFTPETPATLDELRARIAQDQARGYVASHGAYERGIVAVAAPVFDREHGVVAAVNVSGPAAQFDEALETSMKERVRAAARAISHQLGWQPRPGEAA